MIRWSFFDGHRLPLSQACNVPGSMPSRLAIALWLSPSVLQAAISFSESETRGSQWIVAQEVDYLRYVVDLRRSPICSPN